MHSFFLYKLTWLLYKLKNSWRFSFSMNYWTSIYDKHSFFIPPHMLWPIHNINSFGQNLLNGVFGIIIVIMTLETWRLQLFLCIKLTHDLLVRSKKIRLTPFSTVFLLRNGLNSVFEGHLDKIWGPLTQKEQIWLFCPLKCSVYLQVRHFSNGGLLFWVLWEHFRSRSLAPSLIFGLLFSLF